MSITGLLLSSLLLIAAAAASLVYGWADASEPLVLASIGFSAAAAVFLAMGLYRSRPRRAAAAAGNKRQKRRARAGRSGR